MKKLTELLEKYLVPFAGKLATNKFLSAITTGFSYLLPVIMIGALFSLASALNIAPYQSFITSIGLKPILSFASTVTTDMLAVYAVFLIAKAFGEKQGYEKEGLMGAVISLVVFLLMIPLKSIKNDAGVASTFLNVKFLGAAGLFSAIIIGLIVPSIYFIFVKKNITIKMPESVPPTVSKGFGAIIPGLVIVLIFSFIRQGFAMTSYGDFNNWIYTIIQDPLVRLGASPFTFILLTFLCSLLWFFGIHGGMIIMPILNMLYMPTLLENLAQYQKGEQLTNIITRTTWFNFASLGGAGGTLGLCILMTFFAKSAKYKTLGKLAIVPGICGINEPITFGFPMILNTVMIVPMIITPIVTFSISYFTMKMGLVPYPNGINVALGTPAVFSGLVSVGWQAAILQVILIVIQCLIYFPFFKALDLQAVEEEAEIEARKLAEE